MTIQKSGISKSYSENFILEEKTLIRIVDILKKRSAELNRTCSVTFRVQQKNGRFFETIMLEDVLAIPNSADTKIKKLRINLSEQSENSNTNDEEETILWIDFSDLFYERVSFSISYKDHNWESLVTNDITSQLETTFRPREIPQWSINILFITFFILSTILSYKILFPLFDRETLPPNIKPYNFIDNYMDSIFTLTLSFGCSVIIVGFIALASPLSQSRRLIKFFRPQSFFLWGAGTAEYESFRDTQRRIFWGIILGSIVSIVISATLGFIRS